MKHLKLFNDTVSYETWKNSEGFILPNVSYVVENNSVSYDPYIPPLGVDSIPNEASIYGIDGRFYTPEEWVKSGNSNEEAVGVAFCVIKPDGTYTCPPFVIHPSEGTNLKYSKKAETISSVTKTGEYTEAIKDFNGEKNTKYIVQNDDRWNGGSSGTGPGYANGITFKHGKKGYVPAAGELYYMIAWDSESYPHYQKINECLNAINGTPLDRNKDYWSSTSSNEKFGAWMWDDGTKTILISGDKTAQKYVRVIAKL